MVLLLESMLLERGRSSNIQGLVLIVIIVVVAIVIAIVVLMMVEFGEGRSCACCLKTYAGPTFLKLLVCYSVSLYCYILKVCSALLTSSKGPLLISKKA